MFLSQALNEDRSCQKIVNDVAVKRVIGGLPRVSTTTGGYCRARQRLPTSMLSELVLQTNELIEGQRRFKGELRGVQDGEVLIEIQQGTIGLPFEWLADAKLVLTDALIDESLKARKNGGLDESKFDDIETEEDPS